MCRNRFSNVQKFVEYLINERKLMKLDDYELFLEFQNYPGLPKNIKNAITSNSLCCCVKAVCRKNHYCVTRLDSDGRRQHQYEFAAVKHSNALSEEKIQKISTTIRVSL